MKILFIANARRKGGLSGSDGIYEAFIQHWPDSIRVWQMVDIDFKPFWLCYVWRIFIGCLVALFEPQKYDLVYSCSDFLMDSLPAWIMKMKGNKWVAGFYLFAPKDNKIYYWTQKVAYWLINKYADMVIVTNPTMFRWFKSKKKTWINGGIDFSLVEKYGEPPRIFDAVFCGRIHKTKGIDALVEFWLSYRKVSRNATLAVIGDGDMGINYLKSYLGEYDGVTFFGYMGEDRFRVFKSSKYVIYPTPKKYDHFSISPVEAMACGCVMVAQDIPSVNFFAERLNMPMLPKYKSMQDDNLWGILSSQSIKWAKWCEWKIQTSRVRKEIEACVFS